MLFLSSCPFRGICDHDDLLRLESEDGLFHHPDLHSLQYDCGFVLGLILDQQGCCSCPHISRFDVLLFHNRVQAYPLIYCPSYQSLKDAVKELLLSVAEKMSYKIMPIYLHLFLLHQVTKLLSESLNILSRWKWQLFFPLICPLIQVIYVKCFINYHKFLPHGLNQFAFGGVIYSGTYGLI